MARKKDLNNSITEAIILRLLTGKSMYGYEIIKVVNEKTDGAFQWQEGTLYPCLHGLEERGLLKSDWELSAGGKPRKYYALTPAGAAEAAEKTREVTQYIDCVHSLLAGNA